MVLAVPAVERSPPSLWMTDLNKNRREKSAAGNTIWVLQAVYLNHLSFSAEKNTTLLMLVEKLHLKSWFMIKKQKTTKHLLIEVIV